MVLVERLQPPVETDTGLYKGQEEQPKLHICRVLSVGSGREEENGIIASMPDIKVGDTVVVKNPWGIGPKDEELADGRKLSYLKGQDVAGKIEGGIMEE
jgi:co-chaperonin GroES (HSP10)